MAGNGTGPIYGVAWNLMELALATGAGDADRAGALLEQSRELFTEVGSRRGLYNVVANQGNLAKRRMDYEEAREHYEEAMQIARENGIKAGVAWMSDAIGRLHLGAGRLEQARAMFEEGARLFAQLGNSWGLSHSLCRLCQFAIVGGDLPRAREHAGRVLSMGGNLEIRTMGLLHMAIVELLSGEMARSGLLLDEMASLCGTGHEGWRQGGVRYFQGILALRQGSNRQALQHLLRSIEARQGGEQPSIHARPMRAISAAVAGERPEQAIELLAFANAVEPTPGFPDYPFEKQIREEALATARGKVSPAEYSGAWEQGSAMTLDEAVALARQMIEEMAQEGQAGPGDCVV